MTEEEKITVRKVKEIIDDMQKDISGMDGRINKQQCLSESLEKNVNDLNIVVFGETKIDKKGLIVSMKDVSDKTNELINFNKQMKWVFVGVALSGVANLSSVIEIVSRIVGAIK